MTTETTIKETKTKDSEEIIITNIDDESTHVSRAQLILAEKRTSLAVLRSGIAVISLPMSITTLLIATSRLYDFATNLHFLVPLFAINTVLVMLGSTLIVRAWFRIKNQDRMIEEIKKKVPSLREFINETGGKLI